MQLMRSWLFVPGNRSRMVDKAFSLAADAIVFDIEDSVPRPEKAAAEKLIAAAIDRSSQRHLVSVRIAATSEGTLTDELRSIVRPGLDAIVLPKVEAAGDLERMEQILSAAETAAELPVGTIRLLATIETSRGVLAAASIAAASPRLIGLLFGAEDLALDLGLFGGGTSDPMLFARSTIALAAASCSLAAIDRVVTAFGDETFLREDCRQASRLGFCGKAAIHPQQISVVNQAFSPRAEEVAQAHRIVAAYERAAKSERGAISVDGAMVDLPVVDKARRLLAIADAIAKQSGSSADR